MNAAAVLSGLRGAAGRLFDQVHITAFTVLALALRIDSIEGVKTLVRTEAGPLVGAQRSPELHTLRPRLSAIADLADIPALQAGLARAMLALNGQSAGIYYVDDHFVPYGGAKPVAKGHNGKRDRCEKGRADTLFTDERGRAVCFTTAEPSSLAKTMQPGLAQLRAIVPGGKILLGFDRGGAYAEAFTACRARDIDFVTYRRGALAATTAAPAAQEESYEHEEGRAKPDRLNGKLRHLGSAAGITESYGEPSPPLPTGRRRLDSARLRREGARVARRASRG